MSGDIKVAIDHKWKNLKYAYEVPPRVLKSRFDWLDDAGEQDGFIKYRRWWYHVSEFMRIEKSSPFHTLGFHGILQDSFFSGVLIKLSDDGEQYQIATYYS
jgi:hypothetical protein